MNETADFDYRAELQAALPVNLGFLNEMEAGLLRGRRRRSPPRRGTRAPAPPKLERLLAVVNTRCRHMQPADLVDVTGFEIGQLIDHIERTHHAYLKRALPRLDALSQRVQRTHGLREPRFRKIHDVLRSLIEGMVPHLIKEEQHLFPMLREGDRHAIDGTPLANLIRRMRFDHANVQLMLTELRELTQGYLVPTGSCDRTREFLEGLQTLDHDFQRHFLLEEAILLPRVQPREPANAKP